MNQKAEEYRLKAEEAEKLAAELRDENTKALYRNMAREYRELAELEDRRGP